MSWYNKGYLEMIIGPMFSGKSTELIRRIRLAKSINKSVLVIKPKLDDRYLKNEIVSHNFDSEKCVIVNLLSEIDSSVSRYDLIIIDEAQFFSDLKEYVVKWTDNYNLHVVIGGLDGDFKRKPIGQILELIPYADVCEKQKSFCKLCLDGTEAIYSLKVSKNESQIEIGGEDIYKPVCRKHYLENNKKN